MCALLALPSVHTFRHPFPVGGSGFARGSGRGDGGGGYFPLRSLPPPTSARVWRRGAGADPGRERCMAEALARVQL